MSRRSTTIALSALASATFACASAVHTETPEGWSRGSASDLPRRARSSFRELLLCHEEPYPKLNTSLSITVARASATRVLTYYLANLTSRGSDPTIVTPIEESHFSGRPALFLEVKYSMNFDSGTEVVHARLWAVPSGSRAVVVFAEQPSPPDPECTTDLDTALGGTRLR